MQIGNYKFLVELICRFKGKTCGKFVMYVMSPMYIICNNKMTDFKKLAFSTKQNYGEN